MANIDERKIGQQAERMLQSSIRSRTNSFKEHINKPAGEPSLKDAWAKARTKQYGLVKNGTKRHYLRTLSLVMARHGFIRHYGVRTTRAAGSRTRTIPRRTNYHYQSHLMNQPAKPFIDSAVDSSRVVDFIAEKVAESRGQDIAEAIVVNLKRFDK